MANFTVVLNNVLIKNYSAPSNTITASINQLNARPKITTGQLWPTGVSQ
jgi:hypothetical protein